MTPQEKELIQNVANKLKQSPNKSKDTDAESLINNEIGSQDDAIYKLTQAVLVQEMALKELKQKNEYLEKCVAHHKTEANRGTLSKMMGGNRPAPQPPQPTHQPSAFGSFMQTAASVAVGLVAGNMISNMLFNNDDPAAETMAATDPAAEDAATDDMLSENTLANSGAKENSGSFLDDSSSFASDYTGNSGGFGTDGLGGSDLGGSGFGDAGFGNDGFENSGFDNNGFENTGLDDTLANNGFGSDDSFFGGSDDFDFGGDE
ncbi:DUF2076 domain-containing protein [Photobacterium sp. ZSDE20]|uniref:DUF2076 domain-containing protein n=1 Tax=Photobacterium pectinilyticum TaxID=2906793 RepID=A0ABT1N3H0_9GAMM|nr:DUF2076 family protein [Photobacterium sp. ZSDE20]MCQ1059260.1 DUF2076 domain-containing protein [Photobacterium sp. ZSDE20]MDD1824780.1 DUF2076 domain-containing protein [Photobacterium sp. ZSDE20]